MKRFLHPIVEILWIDSSGQGGDTVWVDLHDFEARKTQSLECRTVAYLIEETEDRLILAAHISLSSDPANEISQLSGAITIPKVAVLEQRVLMKARDVKP